MCGCACGRRPCPSTAIDSNFSDTTSTLLGNKSVGSVRRAASREAGRGRPTLWRPRTTSKPKRKRPQPIYAHLSTLRPHTPRRVTRELHADCSTLPITHEPWSILMPHRRLRHAASPALALGRLRAQIRQHRYTHSTHTPTSTPRATHAHAPALLKPHTYTPVLCGGGKLDASSSARRCALHGALLLLTLAVTTARLDHAHAQGQQPRVVTPSTRRHLAQTTHTHTPSARRR